MSIYDIASLASDSAAFTHVIAKNTANTLFPFPLTILLEGEMGAGKTTFSQGLAAGLGIQDPITSPTFALENRYGDTLSHIDLYRLSDKEAENFIHHVPPFPGIRLIEWPQRLGDTLWQSDPHIIIRLQEQSEHERVVTIEYRDIQIPSSALRNQWKVEIGIQSHIIDHMNQVTHVAMICADALIKNGQPVRKEALRAASELHDLFRFVDFKAENVTNTIVRDDQRRTWQELKQKYGDIHEKAVAAFLIEQGFDGIAQIAISHGSPKYGHVPQTIEQKILAYSDKRVRHDEIVTVDERFDDFVLRYGKGKETDFAKQWRRSIKDLETELFGETPPV